jgi:serine/threonine-protein kinase HipA
MAKRRARASRLHIWMNGLPVAYWERTSSGDRLGYFADWLEDEQSRPLSLSLPFTPGNQEHSGERVTAFFDNLLPDNERIRTRLATRYRIPGTEPFDLLATLGRDCVGALQLLPPDSDPGDDFYSIQGKPLSEADVARLLRSTTSDASVNLDADHDEDLRLSVAGAQEKTALLRQDGQWLLPQSSTPTTHLLKLPMGLVGNMQADMRTSVENEWLCSRIVSGYDLPCAGCEIEMFEDQKALVVERFDRRLASDNSWIIRLPQEDMCQATGTPPHKKYQVDEGPGIARIMGILLGSESAAEDRYRFFKTQLLFWMLAATDGHAKNFSLFLLPGGRFRATPIYDVLSAHPVIGMDRGKIHLGKVKLAMAVRGSENHYLMQQIVLRHWYAMGKRVGLEHALVRDIVEELIDRTKAVIDRVGGQLPAGFPMDVADSIFAGLQAQCARLAAMLE